MWGPCVRVERHARAMANRRLGNHCRRPCWNPLLRLHWSRQVRICSEIGRDIDPDLIFRARSVFRSSVGERLRAPHHGYDRMQTTGGYRLTRRARDAALREMSPPIFWRQQANLDVTRRAGNMTRQTRPIAWPRLNSLPARHAGTPKALTFLRAGADALSLTNGFRQARVRSRTRSKVPV